MRGGRSPPRRGPSCDIIILVRAVNIWEGGWQGGKGDMGAVNIPHGDDETKRNNGKRKMDSLTRRGPKARRNLLVGITGTDARA